MAKKGMKRTDVNEPYGTESNHKARCGKNIILMIKGDISFERF